jgi:hypothetical protein
LRVIVAVFIFLSFLLDLNGSLLVDHSTKHLDILPHAQIYIGESKKLKLEDIKLKQFEKNSEIFKAYGYAPPFAVWVRFELANTTDTTLRFVLESDPATIIHT